MRFSAKTMIGWLAGRGLGAWVFWLRWPYLARPVWNLDEGIYATVARCILGGADFIIVRTSPGGHPFDVALPAGASGTLELMITSGPAGSAASDWTYWSDLLLSSAR